MRRKKIFAFWDDESGLKWFHVDKVGKMRRVVRVLVFCSLVILINCVLSQQSWNTLKSKANVKHDSLRLAHYDLSWAPSDITVTFKKDFQNRTKDISQSRALVEGTTIDNEQLPITPNTSEKKTRSDDSLSQELTHSGN